MSVRNSASQMATALANKEISSVELTNQHYEQIQAVDKDVNAFLYLDKEGAIAQATEIDKKRSAGEKLKVGVHHMIQQLSQNLSQLA